MNKKILEISIVIVFAIFILTFLLNYEFSFYTVQIKLAEIIWNYRIIESLSIAILIFVALMGILVRWEK